MFTPAVRYGCLLEFETDKEKRMGVEWIPPVPDLRLMLSVCVECLF